MNNMVNPLHHNNHISIDIELRKKRFFLKDVRKLYKVDLLPMNRSRYDLYMSGIGTYLAGARVDWQGLMLDIQARLFTKLKYELPLKTVEAMYFRVFYDQVMTYLWHFIPDNITSILRHPKNLYVELNNLKTFIVWSNHTVLEYASLKQEGTEVMDTAYVENYLAYRYHWSIKDIREMSIIDVYMALKDVNINTLGDMLNSININTLSQGLASGSSTAKTELDKIRHRFERSRFLRDDDKVKASNNKANDILNKVLEAGV